LSTALTFHHIPSGARLHYHTPIALPNHFGDGGWGRSLWGWVSSRLLGGLRSWARTVSGFGTAILSVVFLRASYMFLHRKFHPGLKLGVRERDNRGHWFVSSLWLWVVLLRTELN